MGDNPPTQGEPGDSKLNASPVSQMTCPCSRTTRLFQTRSPRPQMSPIVKPQGKGSVGSTT